MNRNWQHICLSFVKRLKHCGLLLVCFFMLSLKLHELNFNLFAIYTIKVHRVKYFVIYWRVNRMYNSIELRDILVAIF